MSGLILSGCKSFLKIFRNTSGAQLGPLRISSLPQQISAHHAGPMDLKDLLKVLEDLAPLSLAEPWDNVGLLVEPSVPRPVKNVLLTNDLTEAVMDEAQTQSCDVILSYHPPIFRPMKRLVQKDWKQRLAIRAIEAGIAVFSPHTSWDSVCGGVNDWLIGGLGGGQVSVLNQANVDFPYSHIVEFQCQDDILDVFMKQFQALDGVLVQDPIRCGSDKTQVNLYCKASALGAVVEEVTKHIIDCDRSLRIVKAEKAPWSGHGQGRLSVLAQSVTLAEAVDKMKSHLSLPYVRLALGQGRTPESVIRTVAVCAGSGASVLNGVQADLYVTGEMSHHEVLDAVARGTSVILSDHSNSERGYLAVFREKLIKKVPTDVVVTLSDADKDPLEVV
ncbi:NIF3-like protein 1 isoform X1 [Stigmatopora nigra]